MTSVEPAVFVFADADDVGVGRLVSCLNGDRPVTWWRFGVEEESVSAYADTDSFELRQSGVEVSASDLRAAPLVVYRRRLLQPRPLVSSRLSAAADREFSEREWDSLIEGLLLAEEARATCTWVNSPTATLLGSNKLSLLLRAARAGLPVPPFCVSTPVRFPRDASNELVAKAISADERIDAERHFSTTRLSDSDLAALPGTALPTPSLLQEYVAPSLEVRVFYALGELLSLALTPSERHVDIRYSSLADIDPRRHELPGDLTEALRKFAENLSFSYCTFDLVLPQRGEPALVDVTPNGDWSYFESDARPLISQFLAAAIAKHLDSHG